MKKVDAFVTTEYSLLLPGILAVFAMLVCMGLYLHNQCVLQSNIYLLSMGGATLHTDNNEQRLRVLQRKAQELYHEKYILTEDMQITYKVEGNKVDIIGSGKMINPFSVFGIGGDSWELDAESKVNIISPRETLWLIKKVLE